MGPPFPAPRLVGPVDIWHDDIRGGLALAEIIQFIVDTLPASANLDDVIDALCQRRLELLGPAARELVEELGDEVETGSRSWYPGTRWPLLLGHQHVATTTIYATAAVGRNRADYLRCHPLANVEIVGF